MSTISRIMDLRRHTREGTHLTGMKVNSHLISLMIPLIRCLRGISFYTGGTKTTLLKSRIYLLLTGDSAVKFDKSSQILLVMLMISIVVTT